MKHTLLALALAALGAAAWALSRNTQREFDDLRDFSEWAQSRGIAVRDRMPNGTLVSDRISAERLREIVYTSREISGAPDGWNGLAAAVYFSGKGEPPPAPAGTASRSWGRVLVFGDPRLLDRIDSMR